MKLLRRGGEDLRRLRAQERLIIDATETVCEALERRRETRANLAKLLHVKRSEITQRLSGGRNLTLRSLADMLDALDFDARLVLRDRKSVTARPAPASSGSFGLLPVPGLGEHIFSMTSMAGSSGSTPLKAESLFAEASSP